MPKIATPAGVLVCLNDAGKCSLSRMCTQMSISSVPGCVSFLIERASSQVFSGRNLNMRVTCPSSRPWNFRCTGWKSVAIGFHCKALQSASCQSAPSCCSWPFGGCCRGCIKVVLFFSLGCPPAFQFPISGTNTCA